MKIENVELFYLAMPEIHDIGDGSQDALLVRVQAGDFTGWGECEASPLTCLASWNCPMSHSACKPVSASVLGQRLDGPEDIRRINATVRVNSFDLLQADHMLSGVDVALWDLLGKRLGAPVYRLLGYPQAYPKVAYASQLFGDDPAATFRAAREVAHAGFQAAKFGWGPYGRHGVPFDAEQVRAAREGLGADRTLLVDAGTVWGDNVEAATQRLAAVEEAGALWLEEPFASGALDAYATLAARCRTVQLAGGEGCHHVHQARNMIDHASLGFVQIDTGRIGGITSAWDVATYAHQRGVGFVNHTFTTHLALSASLQPYAGLEADRLCEYPFAPSTLARDLTRTRLLPDRDGLVRLPEGPGLGIELDPAVVRRYAIEAEIKIAGRVIACTASPTESGRP